MPIPLVSLASRWFFLISLVSPLILQGPLEPPEYPEGQPALPGLEVPSVLPREALHVPNGVSNARRRG